MRHYFDPEQSSYLEHITKEIKGSLSSLASVVNEFISFSKEAKKKSSDLRVLVFRLIIAIQGKKLVSEVSMEQVLEYISNPMYKEIVEKLYSDETLKRILYKIDYWLGVSGNADTQIPSDTKTYTPYTLRTSIAERSPDVYLLLMYFAYMDMQAPIDITATEIRALAFGLHWFYKKDTLSCVREIFNSCQVSINRENIQKGIARLMHDGKLIHIYSAEEVKDLIKIEEYYDLSFWNSIPRPAEAFLNRAFWRNGESEEMLLFAEREYLNGLDKSGEGWTCEQILNKRYVSGAYMDFVSSWFTSIGNFAAVSDPSCDQRKKTYNAFNGYENEEYRDALFIDKDYVDAIKSIQRKRTISQYNSVLFVNKTYERFCRIYANVYEMLRPLFGDTVLPMTLQLRKDTMMDIAKHYPDATVHFTLGDTDYRITREQDWARECISVSIEKNDHIVRFEWTGEMDNGIPHNAMVGLRKSKGHKKLLTDEQLSKFFFLWDIVGPCDSIDLNYLTGKIDFFLSYIPEKVEFQIRS